jgi:hypothetical protein
MSRLQFLKRPEYVDRNQYDYTINSFAENLISLAGAKTVYRFGNITTPGISDIDLLVVFENDAMCTANGFGKAGLNNSYLFTHGIMALCENHFYKNLKYTLWSNYIYLKGIQLKEPADNLTKEDLNNLKIQTALEFLAANYVDIKVQLSYRTFKLRSLLQHMKGLLYDLDLLNIKEGKLYDLLITFKSWSMNWFTNTPSDEMLTDWIMEFDKEFENFCSEVFRRFRFYLPPMDKYQIARNTELISAKSIGFKRSGIRLPVQLAIMGRKYINLNNRFNSFRFYVPVTSDSPSAVIKDRFIFLNEMKSYNKKYLPEFMTITTSITSKLI